LSSEAVTARLPREMLTEIEKLTKKEQMDRSELIRRLLDSALQQKRIDDALKAYQDGKVTLWRAAEMSGLSLREMMELAKDKKIAVPYTLGDLKRDLDYVRKRTGSQQQ